MPKDHYKNTLPPVRTEKESEKMHNDIQDAIRQFQEKGGLIRKLPDERISEKREVYPANPERAVEDSELYGYGRE